MVLIGVGGIMGPQDVFDKVALGAHLVQVYTGWVYGGPQFVPDLLEGFVGLMDKHGIKSLEELRGSAL
jgi:dihydroorotate dehydrogenase